MTELSIETERNKNEHHRQVAEEIALQTIARGVSLELIGEALWSIGITREKSLSIVYNLRDRDLVQLDSYFIPQLTAAGEAYLLEKSVESEQIESLVEVVVGRDEQIRTIGKGLLESIKSAE